MPLLKIQIKQMDGFAKNFMRLFLRNVFNAEVVTSVREADEEVVETAVRLNAIGVLGQDSDYVIYHSDVPYLSAQHLDIDRLTTKVR